MPPAGLGKPSPLAECARLLGFASRRLQQVPKAEDFARRARALAEEIARASAEEGL
jgi:hypothetical protein